MRALSFDGRRLEYGPADRVPEDLGGRGGGGRVETPDDDQLRRRGQSERLGGDARELGARRVEHQRLDLASTAGRERCGCPGAGADEIESARPFRTRKP